MPCINIPIDPIGPLIELGISAPISQNAAGAPTPAIRWIRAIADTGCSHTSLHSSIASKCGLSVISKGAANTPAGVVPTNIYHGDLVLRPLLIHGSPYEWRFRDWRIVEIVSPNVAFEALLGMDVLNLGAFMTNGSLRMATFCW
jgi:hypothetical protein